MKAVVQRVKQAAVTVDGQPVSRIQKGLLVLLGVENQDTQKDADYLVDKIINLRIFEDDSGKMNISLKDINGDLLIVSQFTLAGDCRKGRRPSFQNAAAPDTANKLYGYFSEKAAQKGIHTATGRFQAMMDVSLINQGPVTLILDSRDKRRRT